MWKGKRQDAPVKEFLGWVLFLSLLVEGLLLLLEPWSVRYAEDGRLTLGYAVYALLGLLFSTPGPCIALLITLRRAERISLKTYLSRIVATPKPLKAVLITGWFCAAALAFALLCGERNGAPWYMMPLGFLVMLVFVGFAEEPGWRGFLQPELEKRFPFPVATAFTGAIWYLWHLPVWLMPSSNHYGDSLIGFAITIFVWAFVGAAIYKATKSVFACAAYHSFINAIGAVYNWNALFDAYPKTNAAAAYFGVAFVSAVLIWIAADAKEKSSSAAAADPDVGQTLYQNS
jgi:membrane protease YdiL (CAAX protease family)